MKKAIKAFVAVSALMPPTAAYARSHTVDYGKPELITACINGNDRTKPDFLVNPQWFEIGRFCD